MIFNSKSPFLFLSLAMVVFAMQGCVTATTHERMLGGEEQVKLRSMQSRAFDTTDKEKTLRTVIATMQDLGFIVEKADLLLGTVSGTKLAGYSLRLTVSVRPKGDSQLIVRASAQYNIQAVEDPKPYQDFFASLEKAMFLTAHNVD
jgi:hypothetical protein